MGSLQGAIELVSAEPWSVGWAYERIALLLDQEAIPTSGKQPWPLLSIAVFAASVISAVRMRVRCADGAVSQSYGSSRSSGAGDV